MQTRGISLLSIGISLLLIHQFIHASDFHPNTLVDSINPPQAGENQSDQSVQTGPSVIKKSLTPKELLSNLKRLLEEKEVLHDDFYSKERFKSVFGSNYTFRYENISSERRQISFDDLDNKYVADDGALTELGKNRPCLQRGMILFESEANQNKAKFSLSAITSARVPESISFYADLVEEIFGTPESITDGFPTSPPNHGGKYAQEIKTSSLGNSWITYQKESPGTVFTARFRTLGDAEVTEFQILIIGK